MAVNREDVSPAGFGHRHRDRRGGSAGALGSVSRDACLMLEHSARYTVASPESLCLGFLERCLQSAGQAAAALKSPPPGPASVAGRRSIW